MLAGLSGEESAQLGTLLAKLERSLEELAETD